MLQLKIPRAATKTRNNQINKSKIFFKNRQRKTFWNSQLSELKKKDSHEFGFVGAEIHSYYPSQGCAG